MADDSYEGWELDMSFESILYAGVGRGLWFSDRPPECFVDLGLDLIVASITKGRGSFELEKFWYSLPERIEDACYRQDVFLDLGDRNVLGAVKEFCEILRTVSPRVGTSEERNSSIQREGIFVGSVLSYCKAVLKLENSLSSSKISSAGLTGFREYLSRYVSSEYFKYLCSEAEKLTSEIASLSFYMDIKGGTVTVYDKAEDEDYSEFIEKLFERFKPSEGSSDEVKEPGWKLDHVRGHVEEAILNLAARLYRDQFRKLSRFYSENKNFVDTVILRFYREIQFYVSYLDYIEPLKKKDLPFCIPELKQEESPVFCKDCFDLALASKITGGRVVTNDFQLDLQEKIIVVTGPNSGGKTTFARMIGQVHYLAKLGVPVPGSMAALRFVDYVYTHFPRGEDLENMRSKLEEDLVRIKNILDRATVRSVVVINEMFGSTSTYDATLLGRKIIMKLQKIGCLSVYVTFFDELASLEHVVSYVAQVDQKDLETRTYKVVRQPADGLAYARLIAKKYSLTYDDIVSRVAQ